MTGEYLTVRRKRFNMLAGTPRSGSTLLQNILAQNPEIYASSTSKFIRTWGGSQQILSSGEETVSELHHDKERTEAKHRRVLEFHPHVYYADAVNQHTANEIKSKATGETQREQLNAAADEITTVFDKSRGWPYYSVLIERVLPQSKIVLMVRDVRNIVASCLKQQEQTAVFDMSDAGQRTLTARIDALFADPVTRTPSLIGFPLNGIIDLIHRDLIGENGEPSDLVIPIRYEDLASEPEHWMRYLYRKLGIPYFEGHQFDDVINVSEDYDAQWLNKFPHEGAGKVAARPADEWQDWIPGDIADHMMKNNAAIARYNQVFGYGANRKRRRERKAS